MTEPPAPSDDRPPLTRWRRVAASVGALLMALGAGIGLLSIGIAVLGETGDKSPAFVLLGVVLGAVPVFVGFLVWWPALHWNR